MAGEGYRFVLIWGVAGEWIWGVPPRLASWLLGLGGGGGGVSGLRFGGFMVMGRER